MKLIFAQGNPGSQYASTRHNVGFFVLDKYARAHNVEFAEKTKFSAYIAELTVSGEKVLLVKPTTFYNETGRSARALIDFYKLNPAEDFLVIHDDLALPYGTIRTREKGSDAGNNGIKSLNAHIGPEYKRLRIGVYNDLRDRIPDADFVLAGFTSDEKNALPDVYTLATDYINRFVDGSFEVTKYSI